MDYIASLKEYSETAPKVIVKSINNRNHWIYFASVGEKQIPTLALHQNNMYSITESDFRKWCGLKDEIIRENTEHFIDPDYIPIYNHGKPISLVSTLKLIEEEKAKLPNILF